MLRELHDRPEGRVRQGEVRPGLVGWQKFDCYKDVTMEEDGGSPSEEEVSVWSYCARARLSELVYARPNAQRRRPGRAQPRRGPARTCARRAPGAAPARRRG